MTELDDVVMRVRGIRSDTGASDFDADSFRLQAI